MESSILKKAGRFLREQSKNKRWRKVLTVLGAVVVFVTAYVLLMPAVTMERKTVCELQEHTHTEECYGQAVICGKTGAGDETEEPVTLEFHCTFPEELHVHAQECYDGEGELICGSVDYAVHEHSDGCYEDDILVCPLPKIEEHEHTDACYRINDSGFICGQEESEPHKHTEACYTEHKELTCEKTEDKGHTHTAECYTEEEEAVCGQEETAGHTHTEPCYGEDGALICEQKESEGHTHDAEACYETVKKLTCSKDEDKGHQHGSSCYMVNRELTCGKEENPAGHTHTEKCRGVVKELVCGKEEVILHQHSEKDCYEAVLDKDGKQKKDENGELLWELVCGLPEVTEHIHNEECYKEHEHTEECYQEGMLCGLEEHTHTDGCYIEEFYCGKTAHVHTPACYEADEAGEQILVCDMEEHTHGEMCYELTFYCVNRIHAHSEECYQGGRQLTCGYADFVIHTHDENCYAADETLICPLPEIEEHIHTEESCYNEEGSLVCQLPEAKLHTHTEVCYDAEGLLSCGKQELKVHRHSEGCHSSQDAAEEEELLYNKTYEGEGYIVTVAYRADAEIPEEAELLVEQITPEENQEHYARRQAEFQETLEDESATMRALLKIGFYVNGEEIEPKSDVTVTVQLLDEDGLAEGSPITVVHFAEEGTEVLDGSQVKDSSTTFQMGSFSEIAIGYRTGDEVSLYVSEDFEYEDDAFQMTFHVEGKAVPLEDGEAIPGGEESEMPAESETGEETEENIGNEAVEPDDAAGEEAEPADEAEEDLADKNVIPSEADSEEDVENQIFTSEGVTTEETDSFVFQVTAIGKDTAEYEAFLAHAMETNGADELLRMQVFSYTLTYKGVELDLSECKVTVKITTTPALKRQVEHSIPDAVSYLMNYEAAALPGLNSQEPEDIMEPMGEETFKEETEKSPESAENETTGEEGSENPSEEDISDDGQARESIGNETEIIISVAGIVSSEQETANTAASNGVQINGLGSILYDSESADITDDVIEAEVRGAFAAQVLTTANPHFTVQYYANLNVVSSEGTSTNALPVIDTNNGGTARENTGKGNLPQNGAGKDNTPNNKPIKNIYVDDASKKVKTTLALTEVYEHREYEYHKAPTINYIDALNEETDSYTLKELWLLQSGKSADSIERDDWNIFTYSSDVHFANRWPRKDDGEIAFNEADSKGTTYVNKEGITYVKTDTGYQVTERGSTREYIVIREDATLRLVYDTEKTDKDFAAAFYDYDITSGKIYEDVTDAIANNSSGIKTSGQTDGKLWYAYTKEAGINSPGNYTGSGAKLAFGNVNTGTALGAEIWGGNLLNKLNSTQANYPEVSGSYKGCTFGLAKSLKDGKIQYADGVLAPNLFNEGPAAGKTAYDENQYSLKFNCNGDTYTLTAVNGTNVTGLDSFGHPSPYAGKEYTNIWTNDFWPMDSAASYGADGHDLKFGSYANREDRAFAGSTTAGQLGSTSESKQKFPYADDGRDHNSYFGMRYQVEFDLSAEYVGPLEYYFFGDDDMWVFLDEELVCDIGGIHSSVGEYVNLWDYINKEKEKIHSHGEECYSDNKELTCGYQDSKKFVLTFFYTERGASGSTCWMQFTLPSVSSLTPEKTDKDYGNLRIEKQVAGISSLEPNEETEFDTGDEFVFKIMLTDADGNKLPDDFSYVKYDKDGNEIGSDLIIWDGGGFTLKNREYIVIKYLPPGARYKITEANAAFIVDEDGNITEDKSDNYYYTDITIDGTPSKNELTDNKNAEGEVVKGGTSEIVFKNKIHVYKLPESGGPGTDTYTMAGIGLLLIACLMYKKRFRERRAGSSRN